MLVLHALVPCCSDPHFEMLVSQNGDAFVKLGLDYYQQPVSDVAQARKNVLPAKILKLMCFSRIT